MSTPRLFVFVGPSAVGKSFLMDRLRTLYPDDFAVPRLVTTRAPRPSERPADRQFVSQTTFAEREARNEFAWVDSFYDNRYGYTHDALQPVDKHILINALPPMIEQFAAFPRAVMVGLTVAPEHFDLIARRLEARGDSTESVQKRLAALEADVRTMQTARAVINRRGKLFAVQDDNSTDAIIGWVKEHYL